MRIPTIHINGSHGPTLLEGYLEAIRALQAAGKALDATCPNGRDYYVQGDHAIGEAMAQHFDRVAKVCEVIKELEAIAETLT
jgi:hypothetical protein